MNLVEELKRQPIPKEFAFPEEEYRSRTRKTREAMDREGIDVLLVHNTPDICYLTGFQTFFATWYSCLMLPLEGEPVLQTAELEVPAALVHGPVKMGVVTFPWYEAGDAGAHLGPILQERGLAKKRIGVQLSGGLAAIDYERLRGALPDVAFEDVSDLIFNIRVIKSPAEIVYLRKAAEITAAGIRAAQAALATAKTDNDIGAAATGAMVAAGSEYFSIQPIITTGQRAGLVHLTYKRAPLHAGDAVFMEMAGCYQRYSAPMMRTSVLGEPSQEVLQLAELCRASLELVIENVRPGCTGHEVAQAVRKGLASVKDPGVYYHDYFGYSVGIGFPPTWTDGPMYLAGGVHKPLEPGMVFHTARANRIPGRVGVGISETILVTESGCEVLTGGVDRALHVVPR